MFVHSPTLVCHRHRPHQRVAWEDSLPTLPVREHVTTGDHKGFALHLTLRCSKCHSELGSAFSSPVLDTGTNPQPFAIDDIMVLLFSRLGLGYTAMKEFRGVLGIPGMHLETFQEKEKKVIFKTVEVTNAVLQQSADVVRAMHQATNPGDEDEEEDSVCITVSFDGTWRGHDRAGSGLRGPVHVLQLQEGRVWSTLACLHCVVCRAPG